MDVHAAGVHTVADGADDPCMQEFVLAQWASHLGGVRMAGGERFAGTLEMQEDPGSGGRTRQVVRRMTVPPGVVLTQVFRCPPPPWPTHAPHHLSCSSGPAQHTSTLNSSPEGSGRQILLVDIVVSPANHKLLSCANLADLDTEGSVETCVSAEGFFFASHTDKIIWTQL